MKTYVFFIGGTGARVLRSMTMLLASGVKIANNNTIVPIVIDYDAQNGDLKRSDDLMKEYCELHQIGKYENEEKGFFAAKIENKKNFQLVNVSVKQNRETFAKFIGYNSLDDVDKLLLQALYNDAKIEPKDQTSDNKPAEEKDILTELNLGLSIGFQGNPNIGTVVFNEYFRDPSYGYQNFVNDFGEGDRVFVVGSIFGGTGSSGFPQLIKRFRQSGNKVSGGNNTALTNAPVGGCLVLPYFKVKPKADSPIDSMTFYSKAKAALTYYNQEINSLMDEIYYVGCDKRLAPYENIKGGKDQKNDAHLVEMISAMSIIEFANRDAMQFTSRKEKNSATCYEFRVNSGLIGGENEQLKEESFLDLFGTTLGNTMAAGSLYEKYIYHLNSFAFFAKYCQDFTYNTITKGLFKKSLVSRDYGEAYYEFLEQYIKKETNFGQKLCNFEEKFVEWVNQLATNSQLKVNMYDFSKGLDSLLNIQGADTDIKKMNPEGVIKKTLAVERAGYKETSGKVEGEKIFLRIGTKAGNAAADTLNNN